MCLMLRSECSFRHGAICMYLTDIRNKDGGEYDDDNDGNKHSSDNT